MRPELAHALAEATRDLPDGYRAEMFSGADARSTGTKNHPGGVAMDLQIVDPTGKVLPSAGFDASLKIYEQLFQSVRIRAAHLFPGRNLTWIWGGAWISAAAGNGDRMHYQILDPADPVSGASTGSGNYNPVTGIARGFSHASAFMSPAELATYQARVGAQAQADYAAGIPAMPQTAADAITNASQGSVPDIPRTPMDVRRRMGQAITLAEARRDAQGHIAVFNPPANDGGGAYEVAGINVRYHPEAAAKLKGLIEAGRHAEAEAYVGDYTASYTDVAEAWTMKWGPQFVLRDSVFHRGPGGAAQILQRALTLLGHNLGTTGERGNGVDGRVGALTLAAMRQAETDVPKVLAALRVARESYEREDVGYRANFWAGFINRWNKATTVGLRFDAEQNAQPPTQQEPPVANEPVAQSDFDRMIDLAVQQSMLRLWPQFEQRLTQAILAAQGRVAPPIVIDQPPPPPVGTVTPPATTTPVIQAPGTKLGTIIGIAVGVMQLLGWLPPGLGEAATAGGQAISAGGAAAPVMGAMGLLNPIITLLSGLFKK